MSVILRFPTSSWFMQRWTVADIMTSLLLGLRVGFVKKYWFRPSLILCTFYQSPKLGRYTYRITSSVLYRAWYRRWHSKVHAFEQIETQYMYTLYTATMQSIRPYRDSNHDEAEKIDQKFFGSLWKKELRVKQIIYVQLKKKMESM